MATTLGDVHKARGNELLKAANFPEAAAAYGEAIAADPTVAAYWSNRSHALLRHGDAEGALSDADEVARLRPDWAKGHYRRAQALKELGRPREAAEACEAGLQVVTATSEAKELKNLREVMCTTSAAIALSGWWHGTVSEPLGGFAQEFCFAIDGDLRCAVYGQELPGTYLLKDVELQMEGRRFRGGVDVDLNGQKVPYLFQHDLGTDCIDLCCPMRSPPERPRTFDGPGHVRMARGRLTDAQDDGLGKLTDGQRLVKYLEELCQAAEDRVPQEESGSQTADKLLEECEGGGTINSNQLTGSPETLEDKSKKMAQENLLQALRLKYSDATDEAAKQLLQGEVKVSEAYPDEAQDLEKLLRRLGRHAPKPEEPEVEDATRPKVGDAEEPAPEPLSASPEAAPPAPEAVKAPAAPQAALAEAPMVVKPAAAPGCFSCFTGFGR